MQKWMQTWVQQQKQNWMKNMDAMEVDAKEDTK